MRKVSSEPLAEGASNVTEENTDNILKFLTFTIDDSRYGVDILSVREIKVWEKPTELPNSPEYMNGVINLRGVVIPIFDLKKRFGIGKISSDPKNVVIILATDDDKMIGILVDAVSDIIESRKEDIKDSPEMDTGIDDKFISGLIPGEESMTILLDTGVLFSHDEISDTYDTIKKQNAKRK
ncbi:MAG: chemotaxis protein CheW [Proteobacteria bacterium]|nr:chemotaxis protein CheW [Pseudomonadota bacterium]